MGQTEIERARELSYLSEEGVAKSGNERERVGRRREGTEQRELSGEENN